MATKKKSLTQRIDASNKTVSDDLRKRRGVEPQATLISKLGKAKGVERSRVWIEGKRLTAAGFKVGSYFVKTWACFAAEGAIEGRSAMTLELCNEQDIYDTMPCKVSGKGEKPIIDITGEIPCRLFGDSGTHVEVRFYPGKIVILGGAKL